MPFSAAAILCFPFIPMTPAVRVLKGPTAYPSQLCNRRTQMVGKIDSKYTTGPILILGGTTTLDPVPRRPARRLKFESD